MLVYTLFDKLKITDIDFKLNNRKILQGIAETLNFPERFNEICIMIDKIDKIGFDKFEKELSTSVDEPTTAQYDQAKEKYGRHHALQRAGTYKALNRLIQGSAADQTKQAMVDLYNEGMVPLVQIHDELTLSIDGSKETKNKIIDIMTNCVKLAVPSKVDCETGKSWGDAT